MSAVRRIGGVLLLGVGAIHLYAWIAVHYDAIPVIGPLFVANFAVAVALGGLLLAPLERSGPVLPVLAAVSGAGFALSTVAGLEISEASTLFGFHEHGYRTTVALSIAFEGAAFLLLCASALAGLRRARRSPAPRPSGPAPAP